MAQITKEQLEEALTDVGLDTIDLDVIRSYISQLEANQRQPVSNEKLMEAWDYCKSAMSECTPEMAVQGAPYIAIIESALSELEALRAADKKAQALPAWRKIETAPKDGSAILLYTPNYRGRTVVSFIYPDGQMEKHNLIEFTHWMPLPTPPAQEVR